MISISEILNSCKIDDVVSNGIAKWTISSKFTENDKTIIIATPFKNNAHHYNFELWNCGLESTVEMKDLAKI